MIIEDTHGIIFTGTGRTATISRPAGAARMRTFLEQHNFNIEVVDYIDSFSNKELEDVCKRFIGPKTLFVGVSTTFLHDFEKVNHLLGYVKENYPHIQTLFGGSETPMNGFDLTKVDRVFWGYAEEAMLHYLKFLTRKRLDDLPWYLWRNTKTINAEALYKKIGRAHV